MVGFDDFAAEREAEAAAPLPVFVRLFGGEEWIEDLFKLLGAMPQPLSRTPISAKPDSRFDVTEISSRPPLGMACRALMIRFSRTCWI